MEYNSKSQYTRPEDVTIANEVRQTRKELLEVSCIYTESNILQKFFYKNKIMRENEQYKAETDILKQEILVVRNKQHYI